jgi:hypothetical protein
MSFFARLWHQEHRQQKRSAPVMGSSRVALRAMETQWPAIPFQ